MASRTRTKSLSNAGATSSPVLKESQGKLTRARTKLTKDEDHENDMEKENKSKIARGKGKAQSKVPTESSEKGNVTQCLCQGFDDGTPMVCCSLCKVWYHFRCINLGEDEASEIRVYVCPSCTKDTGRRTVSECLWPICYSFGVPLCSHFGAIFQLSFLLYHVLRSYESYIVPTSFL
ncbi:hypothetical protein BV22DRAFT_1158448 [Leucogyrophana mollusca]|uniref:Uncharacterized protein n=1 Tax=Leucogyrophana mollusca TaxID=85980 RepID=A0ACB8BJG2_9AGAM|nr:hypothetical protein BV22DRAFT_1158448 [Leucogyrophana mollusca]